MLVIILEVSEQCIQCLQCILSFLFDYSRVRCLLLDWTDTFLKIWQAFKATQNTFFILKYLVYFKVRSTESYVWTSKDAVQSFCNRGCPVLRNMTCKVAALTQPGLCRYFNFWFSQFVWLPSVIPGKVNRITTHLAISADLFLVKMMKT